MATLFEILPSDIAKLDDKQLTELLQRLLLNEAEINAISKTAVSCSLNTDASDDGGDAEVLWQGLPTKTEWFPSKHVLFQSKPTANSVFTV